MHLIDSHGQRFHQPICNFLKASTLEWSGKQFAQHLNAHSDSKITLHRGAARTGTIISFDPIKALVSRLRKSPAALYIWLSPCCYDSCRLSS